MSFSLDCKLHSSKGISILFISTYHRALYIATTRQMLFCMTAVVKMVRSKTFIRGEAEIFTQTDSI